MCSEMCLALSQQPLLQRQGKGRVAGCLQRLTTAWVKAEISAIRLLVGPVSLRQDGDSMQGQLRVGCEEAPSAAAAKADAVPVSLQ